MIPPSNVLKLFCIFHVVYGDYIWKLSNGLDSNWNISIQGTGAATDCYSSANNDCANCFDPPKCVRIQTSRGPVNIVTVTRTTSISDYDNIVLQFYAYHNGAGGDTKRYCKLMYWCPQPDQDYIGEIDFHHAGHGITFYNKDLPECNEADEIITTFECGGGRTDWLTNFLSRAWIDDIILSGDRTTPLTTIESTITTTDLELTLYNVSRSLFLSLNSSMDRMEVILSNLYDNVAEIEEFEITNRDSLVLSNDTMSIQLRITYKSMYEGQIVNYSSSNQYENEIENKIKEVFNETVSVDIDLYVDTVSQYIGLFIDYADTMTVVIIAINVVAILLAFVAFVLNKIKFKTDSAKALVVIWFGLRLTDVITDINICYILWFDYIEYQRDNDFLFVLCVLCSVFLLIPWIVNISAIYKIKKYFAKNKRSALWFTTPINIKFFLFLVLITGDVFFAAEFISSYIFGIRRLDAGISTTIDIAQLRKYKVFGIICLENIPQLAIALIYFVVIQQENESILTIATLSMALSAISIFVYVTSWCFGKVSTNHEIIEYSIHLHSKRSQVDKMKKKIGYKEEMRGNLCSKLGEELDQMEVVYISADGCSIYVVHLIHKNDLKKKRVSSSYITQKYKKQQHTIVEMFKTYYDLDPQQKIDFEIKFDEKPKPNTEIEGVVVHSDSEKHKTNTNKNNRKQSKSKQSKPKQSKPKQLKPKQSKPKQSKPKQLKPKQSKPKRSKSKP